MRLAKPRPRYGWDAWLSRPVAEQIGSGLEKLGETRLQNATGLSRSIVPNLLKIGGRVVGFGVGVVLGLWDISKGVSEDKKGDAGLANAYYLSGGSGIAVVGAMLGIAMGWLTLGPIGWVFLVLGVLVWLSSTFYIEASKDNKRQEWLRRCYFGTAAEQDKYQDSKTHVEQYKLALAG